MPIKTALTLIAHGSKNAEANHHIARLVDELILTSNGKYDFINYGLLEFAKPSIEEAITVHIENNITTIHIFPFFLAPGNHVNKDIPNIIDKLKSRYVKNRFIMLPLFGSSQNMVNWINSLL